MSEGKKMNWRDILSRSGWTFLQASLSALAVSPIFEGSLDALKIVSIGVLSALLSFAKTVIVQKLKKSQ